MSSDSILRIGFLGAGCINFGGAEGPWDHASRLEKMEKVEFVGIADFMINKAEEILATRRNSKSFCHLYDNCKVYKTLEDMISDAKPDAVLVGVPPFVRGSKEPGKDIELKLVKAGIHAFVEKPLSNDTPEDLLDYSEDVNKALLKSNSVVSVGYMFRYHAAVQKMKELIDSHGGHVMAVNAKFHCAYEFLDRSFWWDVRYSGGPIVEQATHLCDIARYLAGEVKEDSISTICTRAGHPAGNISKIPKGCDEGLEEKDRVPRVTISSWRFQDGGVGCLTHTVALHGNDYEASLEIIMDGMRLYLWDPYSSKCYLSVRDSRVDTDKERIYKFEDDDPYHTELKVFLDAIRNGDKSKITSPYHDAAKSYTFTCAIRKAGQDV